VTRAFTQEERNQFRQRLLEIGRDLFSRYGPEKTTVEELARASGISKGAFYRFFRSKEELFAEVLFEDYPRMAGELISASFGVVDDAREALVLLMKKLVRLIETDALAKAFVSMSDGGEKLLQAMNLANMDQEKRRELFSPIIGAIARAQRRGEIVQGDPLEIAQVLGTIKVFPLYKEQFPPQFYPRLVERTAQVIADGLTCPARRGREG